MYARNVIVFSLFLTSLLGMRVYASSNGPKVPLPGKTIANTKLQVDTLMPAQLAASTVVKNCGKFTVTDTVVIQQPKDLVVENNMYVGGNWREKWTINACGTNVYIPITFVMDNTGTSYIINQKEVYKK